MTLTNTGLDVALAYYVDPNDQVMGDPALNQLFNDSMTYYSTEKDANGDTFTARFAGDDDNSTQNNCTNCTTVRKMYVTITNVHKPPQPAPTVFLTEARMLEGVANETATVIFKTGPGYIFVPENGFILSVFGAIAVSLISLIAFL